MQSRYDRGHTYQLICKTDNAIFLLFKINLPEAEFDGNP